MDQICNWCEKIFISQRADIYCSLSCKDYAKGKKLADKWAKRQVSAEDEAVKRKTRARCLVKLSNVVRYYPNVKSRFYKNEKGKVEY